MCLAEGTHEIILYLAIDFSKTANDSFHSDELSAFETTQASIDECVQREWSAKLSHEQCLDLANLEGKISGSLSACIVSKQIR